MNDDQERKSNPDRDKATIDGLLERNKELERQNTELEKSLSAVRAELHDALYWFSFHLHNSLCAVLGYSQIMLSEYSEARGPRDKRFLENLRKSGDHTAIFVDSMRSMSTILSKEMRTETVDLSEIAVRWAKKNQEAEPEREAEFEIPSGITTSGDPVLLDILMEHLFNNAWEFTRRCPKARIEFGLSHDPPGDIKDDAARTIYFVRDNGYGFEKESSGLILKPFCNFPIPSASGAQIGLSIIWYAVRRHGGKVYAEGAADQGATFYFSLE